MLVHVDSAVTRIEGPWRHEMVAAGTGRFHVVVAGPADGPLVLLLHGFPQFWWAWRAQLPALAAAGYRAAAMNLRGTGMSDKGPRGYEVTSLTRDVAGVVRSLGHQQAVIVGQGIGGTIAWSLPALSPVARGLVAISAPHPLRAHSRSLQLWPSAAKRLLAFAQLPWFPEKALVSKGLASRVLREWGAPGWLDPAVGARYDEAMRIPFAAHSVMEILRWQVRSTWRSDGRRYLAALRNAPPVPTLQIFGKSDRSLRIREAISSDIPALVIPQAGHFVSEEAPAALTAALLNFLQELPS